MKNIIVTLIIAASVFSLNSCSSASKIDSKTLPVGKTYKKVLIKDFSYQGEATEEKGPSSSKDFPDLIQKEILKTSRFSSVTRSGRADANTLVISGEITRFEDGNAALRVFVALGAGNSYFDSTVRFRDGATGKEINNFKVDENSLPIGGLMTAKQNAAAHMRATAKEVAAEASKFSQTITTTR